MDLNTMMREQARAGLQASLNTAVTNGDVEAATKIADDIAKLAVSTTPKAPPYGPDDVRAELDKLPWFGTDPRKSAKAMELGKTLDLKKFADAATYTAALVKAVEEDMKPAGAAAPAAEDETDEEREAREEEERVAAAAGDKKPRRTDGPREGDTLGSAATRGAKGPWTKLTDAPADIQKEVRRTADKMAPKTKDGREKFIALALGAHYAEHQRKAGKK